KEREWARRIADWDEHAIIGVENVLARNVPLDILSLTAEEVQAARVRFVRRALAALLFEGDASQFAGRVLIYLAEGIVSPEEVSQRREDRIILEYHVCFCKLRHRTQDSEFQQERQLILQAVANSQPATS
ncbi:MAG: hypothetical protein M3N59_01835, partial [bacterium]|nr:hypothetical protein [bacterium]